MRILITGIGGFAGKHLLRHLREHLPGAEIHGAVLEERETGAEAECHVLDLRDAAAVERLIADIRPDQIYHLAALSSPARSYDAPWETIQNNTGAQFNLIQACLRAHCTPRLLIISSGDIYAAQDGPVDETVPFHPHSPYAMSKIAQDVMAAQYSRDLPIICARPFNHIGPGQLPGFVAPDFATQIVEIETGHRSPVIQVRNLRARVDFTDVRDVVRAYRLLMEHGAPGEAYNIASGRSHSIQELLDTLLQASGLMSMPEVVTQGPQKDTLKLGDATRLHAATGWTPFISFEQTLSDLLDDCRQRLQPSAANG